jgi:hypothetical protein
MVDHAPDWLTKDQLDTCLKAKGVDGVTEHQLERWRGERLLLRVSQIPLKYRGSSVFYPPGTCEQIVAIKELLATKRKFEHVGWELWWRGFSVGEEYWKPALQKAAKSVDRLLTIINWLALRDEKNERQDTFPDRIARSPASNIIWSRVKNRLEPERLAGIFGTLFEVATGRFTQFASPIGNESRSEHQNDVIRAFDFERSENDAILCKKLNLVGSVVPTLRDIAEALEVGNLSQELEQSPAEIAQARDDVRNALRAGMAFYEATRWIYGPRAFGLRLIAWIAKKSDRRMTAALTVVWIRLRKSRNDLLSSGEIADLARSAEKIRDDACRLQSCQACNEGLRKILSPKRIKAAFVDQPSLDRFLKEIQSARLGWS